MHKTNYITKKNHVINLLLRFRFINTKKISRESFNGNVNIFAPGIIK